MEDIKYPEEVNRLHWIQMLRDKVKDCECRAALSLIEARITKETIARLERELEGDLISEAEEDLATILEDALNGRR
jgi:hypothetical protein